MQTKKVLDVNQFFEEGLNFSKSITEDSLAEEHLFNLLEENVLKILKFSSESNGNLIKLMLLSNILQKNNLAVLDFDIHFESTYLFYSSEKYNISLGIDLINNEIKKKSKKRTLKDKKLKQFAEFEEKFTNLLLPASVNEYDFNSLQSKVHFISSHNEEVEESLDEENQDLKDVYIEEVPLHDGRIYHLFEQREQIKNLFITLNKYLENSQHTLFMTALILFEMENLSSNQYVRNYYHADLVDRVDFKNRWFAFIDVTLDFLKPTVNIIVEK